jgi:hypothetical protein
VFTGIEVRPRARQMRDLAMPGLVEPAVLDGQSWAASVRGAGLWSAGR